MKSLKLFIILIFNIVAIQSSWCNSLFEDANALYNKKKYEEAALIYKRMISKGETSAAVYFNLGNAYYKLGETAQSILNYERALKLMPNDEDINYNLKLANMQTVDKIEATPTVFYQRWWNALLGTTTLHTRSLITIALAWLFAFVFIGYAFVNSVHTKKILFGIAAVSLALFIVSYFIAAQQYSQVSQKSFAIVMDTNPYVKSSPDENSTNLFMLHEGTKVEIMDELEGWKKIRLVNGNVGWISACVVEQI